MQNISFFQGPSMETDKKRYHVIVGNEEKGRISKRMFQENKARQIFRKKNISYPLIRTRM